MTGMDALLDDSAAGWRDVPDLAASLYRKAAVPAAYARLAATSTKTAFYWNHVDFRSAEGRPPDDAPGWLLVKAADEAFLRPAADAFAAAQKPLGGPHPLAASIAGGVLGSGLGYGAGWLAERMLPEEYFERGRLRRTLGIAGGVLGAAPGAAWAGVNLANPDKTGGGLKALTSPWPFKAARFDASAAPGPPPEKIALDAGAMYAPTIPVDAFNQAIWSDVMQTPSPFGSKSSLGDNSQPLSTPPWAAAAASGVVAGAGAAAGGRAVSPWEVGLTAATAAGKGLAAGMLFGRTMGMLAGLRPEAQQALQSAGLWGGLVTGAVQSLFGSP